MSKKYAIGVDFGTEFGRALLVDIKTAQRSQPMCILTAMV